LTGFELFPASIYYFNALPAIVSPHDLIIICGGSFVICLLAAILPARHASKMNTVEALRYE
jgi:lipoprotein-releasing system permease protein